MIPSLLAGLTPGQVKQFDDACLYAFTSPAGRDFLGLLQMLTMQSVLEPTASDAQLRYREGQRSIVAIIKSSMERANASRSNDHGAGPSPGARTASATADADADTTADGNRTGAVTRASIRRALADARAKRDTGKG